MMLNMKNREYANENYECNIYINDVRFNHDTLSEEVLIPCNQGDIITIECKNIILEEKRGYFYILLYWLFSLIGGYGEKNPFGYPFSAVVKMKVLPAENSMIDIVSNSIWEKTPFQVSGSAKILKNLFYCPKEYKRKWWFGIVMPMYFWLVLTLLLFNMLDVTAYLKVVFLIIPIAMCSWWSYFVVRMSNKIYNC